MFCGKKLNVFSDEKKRIETKNLNNQISDREKSCKQIKKALENDKKLTEVKVLSSAKRS